MKKIIAIILLFLGSMTVYAQPQANFNVSREKICSGKQVHFINLSTGAQKYQWYVSGLPLNYALFSTSKDTAGIFTAGTYYIRMVAADTVSGLSDTSTQTISVRNPGTGFVSYLHYAACKGDTMTFKAHYEAINIKWTFNIPQTVVGGCDTCALLKFITYDVGNELTNTTMYDGGCLETTTYTYSSELAPCWPTAINEPTKENQYQIYPNPVTDKLTVYTRHDEIPDNISLYNAVGALVFISDTKQQTHTIDMTRLTPGVYMLRIMTAGKMLAERIIKQ